MRILVWMVGVLFALTASAETYRIGVLLPLSGERAEKGLPLKNAVQLFVDQFNARNAATRLELVVRDDGNDPTVAQAAARELVKDDKLLAVIGHYYTPIALATKQIFADAHIPLLLPNATASALLEQNPWAFMLNLSSESEGQFMAVYIKEVLKKDDILLLHDEGAFGTAMRDAFIRKAARIGLRIKQAIEVPRLKAIPVDWVRRKLPDTQVNRQFGMIVALGSPESGLALLPQLRQYGLTMPVMASNTWANDGFLKQVDQKYTNGVYVASALVWEVANQNATKFVRDYQMSFGQSPIIPAAMAFDAMSLLSSAIQQLQNARQPVSRAGLRDVLTELDWHHAVQGVSGMLFFSNRRDQTAKYVADYLQTRGAGIPAIPALLRETQAGNQSGQVLLRDVYVSAIQDGQFKIAMTQLLRPREEYVLKQLSERIQKGYVLLADEEPYHLVDVVYVGVDVVRINDVNIKDMAWDVDVFIWFKRAEGRLDVKDIERIGVINALKEQSSFLKEGVEYGDTSPIRYRAYRKQLTLEAPYDLSRFPFDMQVLPLSIAHINKNSTHIMLVVDSRHTDRASIKEINPREWTYLGRNLYSDLYRYASTFGDPDYRMGAGYKSPIYFSTVNIEVGVARILQPYFYTFFLPLIILLGIILLVLWVPLDQFAPRINTSISGLVGILLYHMSQKNAFPKVGYTMVADYYFLLAYAFVVSMIICIIFTQTLMSRGEKELAKKWNWRFSIGAIVLAVGLYSGLTYYALHVSDAITFSY